MALKDSDLFAVYRESDTQAYHLKASNLQLKLPNGDDTNNTLVWNGATWVPGVSASTGTVLPDGDADNPIVVWSGTSWVPGEVDGGTY